MKWEGQTYHLCNQKDMGPTSETTCNFGTLTEVFRRELLVTVRVARVNSVPLGGDLFLIVI